MKFGMGAYTMTLLLVVIYLSFISLGLPDSLLGAAWPSMHVSLGVPVSYAGIISFVISGGTVISSLSSMWLFKHLGTGKTIGYSTLLTAFSLLGFSLSPSFILLLPLSITLGLGAGAIDSSLNNYVAVHYEASHMSFLHASWGLGASLGPFILSVALVHGSWQNGYRSIAFIQAALTLMQFSSLKLWKRQEVDAQEERKERIVATKSDKTLYLAYGAFLFYCSYEACCILWISTYFVKILESNPIAAAKATAFFFIGITSGRLLSGFISQRVGVVRMIYCGIIISFVFTVMMLFTKTPEVTLFMVFFNGLGLAPLYPSMIHRTPRRYGSNLSPLVIGRQMATAYVGSSVVPPLMGLLAVHTSFKVLPLSGIIFLTLLLISTLIIENSKAELLEI